MLARSAFSQTNPVAESFARKVAATRTVWTVSGDQGLARVPSSSRPGREVTLCWSSEDAAERFGRRTARNARVNPIMLGNFVSDVLPKVRAMNRLIAPDWTADPFHPQIEAGQLETHLRGESIGAFAAIAQRRGTVYVLEDDIGPAFTSSVAGNGKLALAVWTDPEAAGHQIRGFWNEMAVSDIPVATFVSRTLPHVAGMGRSVSLDPGLGGVPVELGAMDLAARLSRGHGLRRIG